MVEELSRPPTDRDPKMISALKTILPIIVISTIGWGLVEQVSSETLDRSKIAIAATVDDARLDRPVRIELGSKAIYHAENLEIAIVSIRDGRCPKNADCYWGGEAQVTLNVRKHNKNLGAIELTLGTGNPDYFYPNNIKKIAGYYIRAIAIDPYPTGDRSSQTVTQTVTLQVQKTPFQLKKIPSIR